MPPSPKKPCYRELLSAVESLKMQVNRLQEQLKCIQNMVAQSPEDSAPPTAIIESPHKGNKE